MAQRFGECSSILQEILRDGLQLANFAVFMLRGTNCCRRVRPFRLPWSSCPNKQAENGDLVYYKSGYTMFYYNIPQEFVIGLTPVGILS